MITPLKAAKIMKRIKSYAQILKECASFFGFSEEEQEELSKLTLQRNRLAHRYLNFRWQAVSAFANLKLVILRLLVKALEREKTLESEA